MESRRHPFYGWLGTLAVSPCCQTASQGALDFLSVQVTIALDALLIPLKGCSYYFDLTLKRVFILLYTEFILYDIVLLLILDVFSDCRLI